MKTLKVKNGDVYNSLTIIKEVESIEYPNGHEARRVEVICTCGNIKIVRLSDLRSGRTTSCGCYQKKLISNIAKEVNTTHGNRKSKKSTPEYRSWCAMKDRCYREKNKRYPDYGGRGITVCDHWLHSFENFLEDMGTKPDISYTLDRKNNELGYSKDNCQWATYKAQANNRRNNVKNLC